MKETVKNGEGKSSNFSEGLLNKLTREEWEEVVYRKQVYPSTLLRSNHIHLTKPALNKGPKVRTFL